MSTNPINSNSNSNGEMTKATKSASTQNTKSLFQLAALAKQKVPSQTPQNPNANSSPKNNQSESAQSDGFIARFRGRSSTIKESKQEVEKTTKVVDQTIPKAEGDVKAAKKFNTLGRAYAAFKSISDGGGIFKKKKASQKISLNDESFEKLLATTPAIASHLYRTENKKLCAGKDASNSLVQFHEYMNNPKIVSWVEDFFENPGLQMELDQLEKQLNHATKKPGHNPFETQKKYAKELFRITFRHFMEALKSTYGAPVELKSFIRSLEKALQKAYLNESNLKDLSTNDAQEISLKITLLIFSQMLGPKLVELSDKAVDNVSEKDGKDIFLIKLRFNVLFKEMVNSLAQINYKDLI